MAPDAPDVPPDGRTVTDSGQLSPSPPLSLDRGAEFGRYIVLDRLGAGGMGVVYSAYDPDLDRKIALKILRPEEVGDQSRLRREAQAMARLQHPNVITVHDVGVFRDRVFVAMELVDGVTLSRWLDEKPRAWPEIVDCFTQAGRGLAAAHAVGLAHRDFTLPNVLVGRDGRVRVGDFGLARSLGTNDDAAELPGSPSPFEESLTRSGALMGTPSYMSPEQFTGKPADARSDQFGFCVALYRALYRARPFAGDDLKQIAAEVTAGRLRPPPKDVRVPVWVRDIVLRGLATEPEQRWPSMEQLLEALDADPSRRRRRRRLVGAAVVALAAALPIGARILERRRSLVCAGAERKLSGIWDEARKQAMHAAFTATKAPFAEDAFIGASRALDRFAAAWTAMHTDACLATRERREQSEELLDLRMECLGQRLQEADARIDLLVHADANLVQDAVPMAFSLAPVSLCADVASLRAPVRPPADPALRAQVNELRKKIEQERAMAWIGKYREALAPATANAAAARKLGYRPLEAVALYQLGGVQRKTDQLDAAAKTLDDAVIAARAGRDAVVEANAWATLIKIAGQRGQYEQAHTYARHGFAAVEALGSRDERPLISLLEGRGAILYRQGKLDESLADARRGLDIASRLYGAESYDAAFWLAALARTLAGKGQYAEAEPLARHALVIYEKQLGPHHPELPDYLGVLAEQLSGLGRNDEALVNYRRAAAIREELFGPEDARLVEPLGQIGKLLTLEGQYEPALALERRVLAITEKKYPPGNPILAWPLTQLGRILRLQGKPDEAAAAFERAIAILEKAFGPDHLDLSLPLTGLGRIELDRHAPLRALPPLERANAILAKHPGDGDPLENAEAHFGLARARIEAARPSDETHALAVKARAESATAGVPGRGQLAEIDAWLTAHPR